MKNILFILHLPPPIHGSAVVGKLIHDSKIINSTFNTSYINLGTSNSIDAIGKLTTKKITAFFKILTKLFKVLALNKPDLVYLAMTAKGTGFYKDFLVILLVKIFRIPLVIHLHNKGVSLKSNAFLDNLLYRITFKKTKVILLSKHLYPDIKKYVNKNDVYYCFNGIPKIKTEIKTKNDTGVVRLLFLSNLLKTKGVYILLRACKLLHKKNISFFCEFIGGEGDINASDFTAKVKELEIEDVVTYSGKKMGIEKNEAYQKANIFVFPTYFETFGLVNIEAMQHGLPIVSTFEGAIPEIVIHNETGLLVNQKNAEELAEKLEFLILSPNTRESMGKKAQERYLEYFTQEIFEQKFCEILNRITE